LTSTVGGLQFSQGNECSPSAENALQRQQTQKFGQFDEVCRRFPLLSHHIESPLQSASMRTPRCSAKMKPFYVLVGSMGEILEELSDCHFGFPSWREVGQGAEKRSACRMSIFPYLETVSVLSHMGICPSYQRNVYAYQ
jgi:hypothetical protein